jgi:type I restriction enzyme R subunit
MDHHKETPFETELVAHLTTHGWLEGDPARYDRALALYPDDLIGWLQETQPQEWTKLAAQKKGDTARLLLERVARLLDKDGALVLLRHGFKDHNARFDLCQFQPSHGFNPALQARYQQVRCRVVRQVRYSLHNQNSIDLVFFVNGIPVATAELKTDFTQSIHDAIKQYRTDRPPKDPLTKQEEPLLTFKRRALVHFAVSTDQVYMTTRLAGQATDFAPFNLGDDQGAGNPANPSGYRTSYLWERVLQRDAWLAILGRFINLEQERVQDENGRSQVKEKLVFPRFHQWEVVNQLVAAARQEGAGHKYLIQHSAGSGKSRTIAWLAHQLSSLHDAADRKLFDSVIVLTDRTVLDEQLQDAVYDIEHKTGVVVPITDDSVKSHQLIAALTEHKPIIIVTIQTFPALLELLQRDAQGGQQYAGVSFGKGAYALVVDEAHSSQSAGTSHKLKQLLASEEIGEEEEFSSEDALTAAAKARLLPPNTSVFAFTATPKAKTLELFGREGASGKPEPFHVYSMKQAIEEKYILDVLRNYTPFKLAYRLAHNGKDYDDQAIDKSEGLHQLAHWVRLHPYNIQQKVAIIVEHFRSVIAPLLDGKAKAMVVTASRLEAVRYKLAMDAYLRTQGYQQIGVLVAFSGEVNDPSNGPNPFSETNMNPDLKGRSIREAFKTPQFQILIVANKFQTGFDQPLLAAMYVDKRLAGVNAVQTLSRLNRIALGKTVVYVLDFVNDAEEIRLAFAPYYRTAELAGVSDPNLVHDLQAKLDDARIYTPSEVDAFAAAALNPKGSQAQLQAYIAPAVDRFRDRQRRAQDGKDRLELDELILFRKNMTSFVRAYEFLAQIYDYGDTDLEKRCIFYKHLLPWLAVENLHQKLDLNAVELTHYRLQDLGLRRLQLKDEPGEYQLPPLTAVGSAQPHDPEMARLSEIIAQMNELFAGELSDADLLTYARHISGKMLENATLAQQAASNSQEQFALGDFEKIFHDTIIEGLDNYQAMAEQVLSREATRKGFARLILEMVYQGFEQARDGEHG